MVRRNTLLLDFGGVIVRTIFECLGDIEDHFAVARGSLDWKGPLDPARDDRWRATLEGRLSERDYWRERLAALGELAGRRLVIAEVVAAMCVGDPNRAVRPEAKAVIANAKAKGCRVGVLTNDLERIYGRDIVAKFEILREVDVLVDGSWTRIHKPSPEAYTRALAALNRRAEETVFIDDQPRNVDAAMAMGMAGIAFDISDPASSFLAAERLLGI